MRRVASILRPVLPLILSLAACGDNLEGVPGTIEPPSAYEGRCAAPRKGIDPTTGEDYVDVGGSVLDEKLWIRSWTNDLYLWYQEVPDLDIRSYQTPVDYFDDLKTQAITPSGKPKDQFHFTYTTSDWVALSESGVEAGYGLQWALINRSPPRKLLVAYVEPGSPAAAANLDRGAQVQTIDGVDVANGSDVNTLNNGISPAAVNETHTFVVLDRNSTTPRTVKLTSASITSVPVQNVHTLPAPNDKVGYLLFNDHIATAEKALVDAVTKLRDMGITDLVIDIRYNGGGYLDIAAELAYMVAGPTVTSGKTFEQERFNDKYPTRDPVTGHPLTPVPFVDKALGFSATAGQALPHLGLSRVFVLTGSGTCSASEAVMNGLAGVDVDVIQIGSTTCGKPYGFYPADNCGTTYFAIQFQGVNQKGFGDYADGFIPGGKLHGCVVADDFTHGLGDPAEGRLAAALAYRANGTCPATFAAPVARDTAVIPKPLWRQNRIITHRR
ncbi:MAG TPA: S41 family peptidase [Kofleriaceae bacterium]|jgi:C-terminal processing protease CtpA/Prc|nr:S41 family peptidase [Kofleriaceae bacterium]